MLLVGQGPEAGMGAGAESDLLAGDAITALPTESRSTSGGNTASHKLTFVVRVRSTRHSPALSPPTSSIIISSFGRPRRATRRTKPTLTAPTLGPFRSK